MTTVEKRALYNLLRMHQHDDTTLPAEPWQIEDYRKLPFATLFERLKSFAIHLDKDSFLIYANNTDSPEELTENLIADRPVEASIEDAIYLLIFELWRRLMSKKLSLSVFCDELDYLIFSNDHGQLDNPLGLQNAVGNLIAVLNDNVDLGLEPEEAFKRLSEYCANDLETFLYDYICEQIELENESYAQELLENLNPFTAGNKWFALLRAKIAGLSNINLANRLLAQLIENTSEERNVEFNLEMLACMASIGTPQLFYNLTKQIITQLRHEEDFQDLLSICIDYYHYLDEEQIEQKLNNILEKRAQNSLQSPINQKDAHFVALFEIMSIS